MSEKKSWWGNDGISIKKEPLKPPPPLEVYMPEGINFDELWKDEEPEGGNMLQTVMMGASAFFGLVTMILVIVK